MFSRRTTVSTILLVFLEERGLSSLGTTTPSRDTTRPSTLPTSLLQTIPILHLVLRRTQEQVHLNERHNKLPTLTAVPSHPSYCGSCWLHGGLGALHDRIKIRNRGQDVGVLARQTVLNCGQQVAGSCGGGSDIGLYEYIRSHGLPDETCQQYEARDYQWPKGAAKCSAYRTCMNCDPSVDGRAGAESGTGCYAVQHYGKYFVAEYGAISMAKIVQELAENYGKTGGLAWNSIRRGVWL